MFSTKCQSLGACTIFNIDTRCVITMRCKPADLFIIPMWEITPCKNSACMTQLLAAVSIGMCNNNNLCMLTLLVWSSWWPGAKWVSITAAHINRFVQERRKSNALAMELRPSCTNPSICPVVVYHQRISGHGFNQTTWYISRLPFYFSFLMVVYDTTWIW